MSLIRQLWIAIIIVMSLAFGGSLVVSTLSARHYLEQQLYVKNVDNATSLALSLSQMPKDDVTVELQVAAQFDAGHYRLIRLTAPSGDIIVERAYDGGLTGAPEWFARLIPIDARAGIAQVQDGWHQYGTLTLESHSRYAYESLWTGTLQLLLWFFIGATLTGLLGTVLLKRITRPLDRVVEQAEAIGGRRFVTTDEPRTTEFRSVVRAMNLLSERVRAMLAEESQRLEKLRQQAQHDDLTGLLDRRQFMNLVDAALTRDDATTGGTLAMTRLGSLGALNQQLGRTDTDRLLCDIAAGFAAVAETHAGWEAGRLNATDFALLAVGDDDADQVAQLLARQLDAVHDHWRERTSLALPIGAAAYMANEDRAILLARADAALAAAELAGERAIHIARPKGYRPLHTDLHDWRRTILGAIDEHGIRLAAYPVVDSAGRLLHREAPMRLFIDGTWQSAGYFMPQAARLGLLPELDRAVLETAIAQVDREQRELGINLSVESLRDAGFRGSLFEQLQAHPEAANRLWIELPEYDVVRNLGEFRALCLALKPLGCRIGIEHVGRHFSRIGELHELGLDYVKTDASLTRGIESNGGNQNFLRGLCTVTHAIGLIVIAEGVCSDSERETLIGLGVDAFTGPGV